MSFIDLIKHENNEELMTLVLDSIRGDDDLSLKYLLENRANELASIEKNGKAKPGGDQEPAKMKCKTTPSYVRFLVSIQQFVCSACTIVAMLVTRVWDGLNVLLCYLNYFTVVRMVCNWCTEKYSLVFAAKEENYTQLHVAASYGSVKCLRYLLDSHFAQFNSLSTSNSQEPLLSENVRRMKQLLLDLTDYEGYTPIHDSVEMSHAQCTKELIRYGCSINTSASHGNTPLHYAARNDDIKTVEVLLKNGACPNVRNAVGKRAADMARKHSKVYSVLEDETFNSVPSLKTQARQAVRAYAIPDNFEQFKIPNELKNYLNDPDL